MGEVAVIGISAGASIALRSIQTYPHQVTHVVSLCGPVHPEHLNRQRLHGRYPLLERSLEQLSLENLSAERVMTLRPVYDEIFNTKSMKINGATDLRINMVGHATSIAWGVYRKASRIHDFIRE